MKKQGGFTLIELVVVIVILGILAVTAAPRFLNLQSDARESSLQGLKGAMAGAGSIVYGKAAIEGVETLPKGTDAQLDDETTLAFGYPTADEDGIVKVVQGLEDDTEWVYGTGTAVSAGTPLVATFANDSLTVGSEIENTECYVSYIEPATSTATPLIAVVDDKC
ncbi:type II secretion system protein [Vibrio breoganii]|uniref:type II secretion system protein n=1 Tax=Vibrio breoganii TaxID=553239 RepID=UPI0021C3AF4A|nr:type II secretion system protein [Vibrio breoganii]MDN3717331.1 type II secretion system protein [Vibrio breoganii]